MAEIHFRIDTAENGFVIRKPGPSAGMLAVEWVAKTYDEAVDIVLVEAQRDLTSDAKEGQG